MIVARYCVIALALAGCKSSMKGRIELTADGQRVEMQSAYLVPRGTEGFRVEVSSVKRDCAWAERQGLGVIEDGETHASIDFAPVIDGGGAWHWRAVGAGWTGRATSGNVGAVAWPADVTGSRDRHIVIASDSDKHVHVHGDFDAVACGPTPPPASAPATVTVGGKTFPLTVASAKPLKDRTWSIRVSKDLATCTDDVTGADIFVDFYADADFTTATSFHVQGNVLPSFGYEDGHDAAAVPKIVRTGETLAIDGVVHGRELGANEGPALDFQIHGALPLTACPGPHRGP
ncbi:MAG TPA: hypothetical protein VGC41_28195 [Kofleriaceae bacterium]